MSAVPIPGFPSRFPVRDGDRRTWRYRVAGVLFRAFFRLRFGRLLSLEGLEHIPDGPGPMILACNHLSNLDPALVGGFFPRTLFAMAKKEMFANRAAAWFWGGCNTFPVDRGAADRRALRIAIDVLRRNGRLVLFVEGTRATRPGMKQAEPGVGFLIRRAAPPGGSVPVLPAAVWGTEQSLVKGRILPRRVPIHMRFGPLFTPDLGDTGARHDQAVADDVARHVAALLPPEYRGHYA